MLYTFQSWDECACYVALFSNMLDFKVKSVTRHNGIWSFVVI